MFKRLEGSLKTYTNEVIKCNNKMLLRIKNNCWHSGLVMAVLTWHRNEAGKILHNCFLHHSVTVKQTWLLNITVLVLVLIFWLQI